MTIFDLTIGKVLTFVEDLANFLFETPLTILRAIGLFFSLLISIFLIIYWLKLEKDVKNEIDFWNSLKTNLKEFYFIQKPKHNFEKIKKIYYQNKPKGLIELNKFFDFVLQTFGYEGSLEEKLSKINPEILPNLEEIKKAFQIIKIIDEKLKNGELINLSEEEYLIVFHEYEKALFYLGLITIEDFLVKNLE